MDTCCSRSSTAACAGCRAWPAAAGRCYYLCRGALQPAARRTGSAAPPCQIPAGQLDEFVRSRYCRRPSVRRGSCATGSQLGRGCRAPWPGDARQPRSTGQCCALPEADLKGAEPALARQFSWPDSGPQFLRYSAPEFLHSLVGGKDHRDKSSRRSRRILPWPADTVPYRIWLLKMPKVVGGPISALFWSTGAHPGATWQKVRVLLGFPASARVTTLCELPFDYVAISPVVAHGLLQADVSGPGTHSAKSSLVPGPPSFARRSCGSTRSGWQLSTEAR
jgi:hypothetical protein